MRYLIPAAVFVGAVVALAFAVSERAEKLATIGLQMEVLDAQIEARREQAAETNADIKARIADLERRFADIDRHL